MPPVRQKGTIMKTLQFIIISAIMLMLTTPSLSYADEPYKVWDGFTTISIVGDSPEEQIVDEDGKVLFDNPENAILDFVDDRVGSGSNADYTYIVLRETMGVACPAQFRVLRINSFNGETSITAPFGSCSDQYEIGNDGTGSEQFTLTTPAFQESPAMTVRF